MSKIVNGRFVLDSDQTSVVEGIETNLAQVGNVDVIEGSICSAPRVLVAYESRSGVREIIVH